MALSDSIEKFTAKTHKCTLAIITEMLDKKDREVLLNAIKTGVPTTALVSALRSEGFQIAEATFNKHRNGKCLCPSED